MDNNEREYLLGRAEQELRHAAAATSDPVRCAHQALAKAYTARAALLQPVAEARRN